MTSLSKNARVAGFLYIVGSLVAVVRLIYIPSTLIVSENATATVNNIARHELLFRFGILKPTAHWGLVDIRYTGSLSFV
jgi:hypothetical protein